MLHEKHRARLIFLALLVLCAVVITAQAETSKVHDGGGAKVLAAALAKARGDRGAMGIAVADAGANLVGFIKMDGAFVHPHYNAQGQGLQRRLSRQSPLPHNAPETPKHPRHATSRR